VLLPLMATLAFGIMDLGRVFTVHESLVNAARESADYVASHPGQEHAYPGTACVDPANADIYRNRGAAYTQQLRDLDTWAHAEMAAVPTTKRRVLSSHDSLQYFGVAFGITMISVNGWTNKSEPSAADLARMTDQIRRDHVKALFLDSITDPRAMERISKETGAVIGGTLYGDALSMPDGEAGTYIEMIRHDISTLKAGMLRN